MRILSKEFPDSPLDGQIADYFIDVLTPNGKVKKRISIFEAFYHSDYASYLDLLRGRRGDVFHTNTILVIENPQSIKIPGVEKGDMLISIREMNTIALIDSETEKVKWAFMGFWRHQHQPLILPDGNILIFDNHGGNKESYFQFNQSRVIEFDPAAQKIIWQYREKKNSPFFTDICGFIQRLPNGNTLITETMNGRAFEVTPDKEIVWEYVSPFRAGEKDQLVAVVCGMTRVNPDKLLFLNEN